MLYQAKIHPGQPSNTLLQEELVALHAALRSVIGHAVKVDADQYGERDLICHGSSVYSEDEGMFFSYGSNVHILSTPQQAVSRRLALPLSVGEGQRASDHICQGEGSFALF